MRYIALVDGRAGAYGVVVPDLPGCTSAGSTTDEALRNAVEAVRLWVEDAIDDGETLPSPRSAEVLRADSEIAAALAEGAALAFVPLLLDAGRAVRANLSLDAGLLDARRSGKGSRADTFSFSRERGSRKDRRAGRIAREYALSAHAERPPCQQTTRLASVCRVSNDPVK
jgi:predicted RNase H-like HicB family nuclease